VKSGPKFETKKNRSVTSASETVLAFTRGRHEIHWMDTWTPTPNTPSVVCV